MTFVTHFAVTRGGSSPWIIFFVLGQIYFLRRSAAAKQSLSHRREAGEIQPYFVGAAGFWRLKVACSRGSDERLPSAVIA